ncbi:MAG TPA: ABC transporter ATP-binding protein [Blastocatellia bacterium]|nr:ABC transporter ATP-binding protein [Blastocatellia bacterium]
MSPLDECRWPAERLGEAIEALGRASLLLEGTVVASRIPLDPPAWLSGLGAEDQVPDGDGRYLLAPVGAWIEAAADRIGLEAEPVSAPYSELRALTVSALPLLLMVQGEPSPGFLLIVRGGSRSLTLVSPSRRLRRIKSEEVINRLLKPFEQTHMGEIETFLRCAGIPPRRLARASRNILRERLSQQIVEGCWMLRLPPGSSFLRQVKRAGLWRQTARMLGSYVGINLLTVAGWWMIGKGALSGRLETEWMAGWALCLLSMGPLLGLVVWSQGVLSVHLGALLKQRLLWGAMKLDLRQIREKGAGQLLGTVIESQAVESLALRGGFFALFAAIELIVAFCVLILGSGGATLPAVLSLWALAALAMGNWYYKAARRWTRMRLGMTHDLVEGIEGHRTRLVQESPDDWHTKEDQALAEYAGQSQRMDRIGALLLALAPRGSLLVSIVALAPDFIAAARGDSPGRLAVELGGVILAYRAFENLAQGVIHLSGAAIAWREAGSLFRAASDREPAPDPNTIVPPATRTSEPDLSSRRELVVDARDLTFQHERRPEPVLKGCNLEIREGDRILIEGPSGSGKSTLGSLLSGLRTQTSGLILVRGLDRATIGLEGWRNRIAAAPQFHENAVLTDTLAFNLLMARGWPPAPSDLEEAEAVCRELGLGELLDRMPLGLFQMVGEVGWQLSHGERTRIYMARALLQKAEMIILDESLAGLDPEALGLSLDCVSKRAGTLLAIAHL